MRYVALYMEEKHDKEMAEREEARENRDTASSYSGQVRVEGCGCRVEEESGIEGSRRR